MCDNIPPTLDNAKPSSHGVQSPLAHRFITGGGWDIRAQMRIREGSMCDYHALSRFHYRSARPGAPTRVLVLEHVAHNNDSTHTQTLAKPNQSLNNNTTYLPAVTGRTHDDSLHTTNQPLEPFASITDTQKQAHPAAAARHKSLSDHDLTVKENANPQNALHKHQRDATIVGVLVESLPALSCSLRDYALNSRFGSPLTLRQRAKLLNAEVRCISRVVIHPQYRGLSLAVHLVQHALTTATTRFTESLAAMGQVNPFFEKAGMTAYSRPQHARDARLTAALASININQSDLVRIAHAAALIAGLPNAQYLWIYAELKRWASNYLRDRKHQKTAPHKAPHDSKILHDLLDLARKRLFFKPLYYLHLNNSDWPSGYHAAGTDCGSNLDIRA
ncbi:hypothetical protein KS4_36490 [Poriferisphaera corsica]|uniref:Uncharacterized protein n=1 Tax=Poriferisphaera corsica TaxID=2528020 RepID=A0A517YZA5_9BACT|nr:hypothetical protein [Poriferisphaera corsica]QDU35566.1 hypothetical protein KS4_36490 [Poriferisphaera corsica]